MRTRTKILMTALSAALVLAAAVGSADARRLETSNQNIRVVWPTTERLTFTGIGGLIAIDCSVTLEGSFHSRTISKVSGQLVGYITRAALTRPCGGSGEAWILNGVERPVNTLPWHIRYDSFKGTLPRITGVRVQLVGAAFLVEILGSGCLYQSTAAKPAFGIVEIEAGGVVTGLRAEEGSQIPLSATLAGSCPPEGSFTGKGNVTLTGTTTRITVRLVQ